jgi:hypothetical protein
MRYNQLFSSNVQISIEGDFSLHAGDAVFLGVPPENTKKNDESKQARWWSIYYIRVMSLYFTKRNLSQN